MEKKVLKISLGVGGFISPPSDLIIEKLDLFVKRIKLILVIEKYDIGILLEISQLQAFVSLARTRNFSRTAELLHLVQSTVSTRIRALEENLGKPLFERTQRNVELTEAGRALLAYAERILSLCDEGSGEVRAISGFAGRLSVGATDSVWRYLLRPVLVDYMGRRPGVSVVTKTARSSQIVQMVADGLVSVGFAYSRPRLPGLVSFPVYDDEILLVARASHPSARRRAISRDELAGLPLLYCDWDGPIREWIQGLLPHGYLSPFYPDQLSILLTLLL
jgi:LysR family transcriptional repressor of citA